MISVYISVFQRVEFELFFDWVKQKTIDHINNIILNFDTINVDTSFYFKLIFIELWLCFNLRFCFNSRVDRFFLFLTLFLLFILFLSFFVISFFYVIFFLFFPSIQNPNPIASSTLNLAHTRTPLTHYPTTKGNLTTLNP